MAYNDVHESVHRAENNRRRQNFPVFPERSDLATLPGHPND